MGQHEKALFTMSEEVGPACGHVTVHLLIVSGWSLVGAMFAPAGFSCIESR